MTDQNQPAAPSSEEVAYAADRAVIVSSALVAATIIKQGEPSNEEIQAQVKRIVDLMSPTSMLSADLSRGFKAGENIEGVRALEFTILGFDFQTSSHRLVIFTKGMKTEHTIDGLEAKTSVRFDGDTAAQYAEMYRGLFANGNPVGQRARLAIVREVNPKTNRKFTMVTGAELLGPDPDYSPEHPDYSLAVAQSKVSDKQRPSLYSRLDEAGKERFRQDFPQAFPAV